MPKTKLFIGSSSAARSQAKAVITKFTSPTLVFEPWWEAFTAGRTLLEGLDNIKADGALMLFTPELESTVRKNEVEIPNLNVFFEFAYFYGKLGRQRVAMLKYGDFYLPTDLGGYIHIFGSKRFARNQVVQVGKRTENEFARWIGTL